VNDSGKGRAHRIAVLNGEYHIECSTGFAPGDRLPVAIEDKVRELMVSLGTDEWTPPERYCVLSPGLFMRVFPLVGAEAYRIGVTLERRDERGRRAPTNHLVARG